MPDREKTIAELANIANCLYPYIGSNQIRACLDAIELLREQDVVWTRRSSFWIDETAIDEAYLKYRCQRCGKQSPAEMRFPFCPWCGAKMEVSGDG